MVVVFCTRKLVALENCRKLAASNFIKIMSIREKHMLVDNVKVWDGSGVLHQKVGRSLKRKLSASGGKSTAKKRKRSKDAQQQKELEERKRKSLTRAKDKIFPQKMKESAKTNKDVSANTLEDNHNHLLPSVEIHDMRESMKSEFIYLISLLDELEIFLVHHQPQMEERSSFGEKVQARIRYTCSTVASQIEQYLDTFPMQSRTRGNMISRMRKRTGIEDNYEALKGMDELHMMTLRYIPKRP